MKSYNCLSFAFRKQTNNIHFREISILTKLVNLHRYVGDNFTSEKFSISPVKIYFYVNFQPSDVWLILNTSIFKPFFIRNHKKTNVMQLYFKCNFELVDCCLWKRDGLNWIISKNFIVSWIFSMKRNAISQEGFEL